MKAAFKRGSEIILKDIQLRAPAEGEIRVKVEACGICGTDLHNNPAESPQELPFGHEVAATVIETGKGVDNVKLGQKVVLDSATPCGTCDYCRNAQQEFCVNVKSFWFTNTFGFAEEMLVPSICAVPRGDLPPDIAALSEPLGVAIDLVRLAEININSNVLIMGPGPIGLMALSLVKRMGAHKIFMSAFAKEKARVQVARKFGVDGIIDPSKTSLAKYDFGCKIDRVLVTTPPPTLADAVAACCQGDIKGGIIAFIGIGFGENSYCRFNANNFHFKKLQLRASFASPALFGAQALQYLREGVVDGPAL
ncbi:MAG: alcohol dehydrogenase catalytic domain-containing protein, partial [Verrucomicrobiota bacterium]